jgi:DNA-binding XRE family transcriptional regulator
MWKTLYENQLRSKHEGLYTVFIMSTSTIQQKFGDSVMGGVTFSRIYKESVKAYMTSQDIVKALRARAHMTQEEFAKAVDVTRGAIATYETGSKRPSLLILDKMAKLSGLQLSDLLRVPSIDEMHDRIAEDAAANANLQICLRSPSRRLAIESLAFFALRARKARK